jgi:endonuclease YncB( thermonuclease family)
VRPLHAAFAGVTILVTGAAIATGGRLIEPREAASPADPIAADAGASRDGPATAAISKAQSAKPATRPKAIDPEIVAQPGFSAGELERVEPRGPLSKLALATPPKPKMPEDWKGTTLFQPVASAAGTIEAKGYSIAISGIDLVEEDETCSDAGKSWACGKRARTAFRAFLRGRAVVCAVPPEGGRDLIAAQCRIGKQDICRWLVENGWARATAGGPYTDAGEKAQAAKKGIFGPPPARIIVTLSPAPTSILPAPLSPPDELSVLPAEPAPTVPVKPGPFPPAPTPPTDRPEPFQ